MRHQLTVWGPEFTRVDRGYCTHVIKFKGDSNPSHLPQRRKRYRKERTMYL